MTTKKASTNKVKKIEEIAKEADAIVESVVAEKSIVGTKFMHGTRKAIVISVDGCGICTASKQPDRTRIKCPDINIRVTTDYVEHNKIG